jgi:hypothetical protein
LLSRFSFISSTKYKSRTAGSGCVNLELGKSTGSRSRTTLLEELELPVLELLVAFHLADVVAQQLYQYSQNVENEGATANSRCGNKMVIDFSYN